jgi:DNA-directed RNA polymerase delta subunit
MVDAIHIHEDSWGMRNLYPLAAVDEANADMDASDEVARKHQDTGLLGVADMHVIENPTTSYIEADLKLMDA